MLLFDMIDYPPLDDDVQYVIEEMRISAEKGIFGTALNHAMWETLQYLAYYPNAPHHDFVRNLFEGTTKDRDELAKYLIVKLPIFRQLVKDYIKEYFENNGIITQSCMRGWSKLSNNMLSTDEA